MDIFLDIFLVTFLVAFELVDVGCAAEALALGFEGFEEMDFYREKLILGALMESYILFQHLGSPLPELHAAI